MSASTQKTVEITVRHPDGSIRLGAPADVPIRELMPDVLDITGQPERDGWVLSPDGADPYPGDRTLAELEVDGATLVLHEQIPPALDATGEQTQSTTAARASASRSRSAHAGRPLSELTARTLPMRLSLPHPPGSGLACCAGAGEHLSARRAA